MPHPTALIADVKGSRQIENWPEVFDILKKTLREVNRRFKDEILVKFAPTVGDEFQGALKSPEKAYDVYTFIKTSLPVPIYCGLGIGEVEVTAAGSAGLRGTAFYRAREALETCKQNRASLFLRLEAEKAILEKTINTILELIDAFEGDWTDRQRQIVSYYRLNPGLTYETLGRHFEVSKPLVHKVLKTTKFKSISRAESLIVELLSGNPVASAKG